METQIIFDQMQNQEKQVIRSDLQHGSDSLSYAFYDVPAGAQFDFMTHWHVEYEIVLLLDGFIDFIVDGHLYHLSANDILCLNSNCVHGHADFNARYGRYLCFSFGGNFLFPDPDSYLYNRFFMPLQSGQYTFTKHISRKEHYAPSIRQILDELAIFSKDIYRNALSIQIGLLNIYNIMLRENAFDTCSAPPSNRDAIKSALWYINQNYTQPVTIKDIADFLNMSTDHFTRRFKVITGVAPKEYIQNLRIRHAINEMDSNSSTKLTEIAYNSGFSDANYFSRAFKKYMGASPSEYQKYIRDTRILRKDPLS